MANNFALKAILTAQNKMSPVLKTVMKDIAKTSQAFAGVGQGMGNMLKATLPFAALGGIGAMVGKSMLDTTAQFEKFSLVLETLEGSQAKAAKSMSWISDFAAKTPYELAQVTDGFVKLKSYGIDPIQGQTLRVLGDTAAAMGKDLNQAVEALADAVTGENERLKEFGVTSKKVGKDVLYSFTDKSGKQRTARAKADSHEQIRLTLMAIWNQKYGGAMDKLSGSWSGLMSNLSDQFARFSLMVMQSGAFDWMKNKLSSALDKLNQMAASGELKRLAETIGGQLVEGLKEAWKAAKAFNGVVLQVKDAVGGWSNLFKLTAAVMAGPLILATVQTVGAVFSLGSALFSLVKVGALLTSVLSGLRTAVMAFMLFSAVNPVILGVIAAVALLAGVAYLVYRNWGALAPYFKALWGSISGVVMGAFSALKFVFLNFTPLGLIVKNWMPIKAWLGVFWGWLSGMADTAFDVLKNAFLNFTPLGLIIQNWMPMKAWFAGLWQAIGIDAGVISAVLVALWDAPRIALEAFVTWALGRVKPLLGLVKSAASMIDSATTLAGPDASPGVNRPTGTLIQNSRQQVGGEIKVKFDNAPPGMRVETQQKNGGVSLNPDVGYRVMNGG